MIRVFCVLVGRFITAARSFGSTNPADVQYNLWPRMPQACLRVSPSNLQRLRECIKVPTFALGVLSHSVLWPLVFSNF